MANKKKTGIAAYREKKTIGGKIVKALTSLKTTAVLGTVLAAELNPAAAARVVGSLAKSLVPKTALGAVKAAVVVPTAAGVLASSKTARKIATKALHPVENIKRGEKIGELIDNPKAATEILGLEEKETLGEKIKTGLKAAGVIGGAAALGAGAVAAVKKVKEFKEKRNEQKLLQSSEAVSANLENPLESLGLAAPVGGVSPQLASFYGSPTLSDPLQSTNDKPPIQNIIQIAVR